MTLDIRENELRMSEYVTRKTDEIGRAAGATPEPEVAPGAGEGDPAIEAQQPGKRTPAERRRAVMLLLEIWQDVARDLAIAGLGGRREVRDPALLDDLVAVAASVPPAEVGGFLAQLDRVAELVEGNTGPELALDVLVLAWPRAIRAATGHPGRHLS